MKRRIWCLAAAMVFAAAASARPVEEPDSGTASGMTGAKPSAAGLAAWPGAPVIDTATGLPSPALIVAMADWLSHNFGLPRMLEPPAFAILPAPQMALLWLRGAAADHRAASSAAGVRVRDIVAAYDTESRTIYLREGWTGRTLADLSILVHEMVHHLQNEGRQEFACPELREHAAFAAQERWLEEHGSGLHAEFGLDGMTLLVRTKCLF